MESNILVKEKLRIGTYFLFSFRQDSTADAWTKRSAGLRLASLQLVKRRFLHCCRKKRILWSFQLV